MLNKGILLDNRYEVIKTLGKGGMSTVYLTRDTRLEKLWAVKEVKNSFRDQMDLSAEPNILKGLNHPGIPKIIDIFYENNNLYMVEDYIEGDNLEEYVKKFGALKSKEVMLIASKLCNILEYLHGLNPPIIYRDLKPQNIIISNNQEINLVDFGISRTYKTAQEMDTIIMGTKGYAAPEQYGIGQSDFKTDIYGLGAVMYYLIAGRSPDSLFEPLRDESYSEDVDNNLKEIIKRCMKVESSERFENIGMLKQSLNNINRSYEEETRVLNNEQNYVNNEKTQLMGNSNILNKSIRKERKSDSKARNRTKKILLTVATLVILILCFTGFALYNANKPLPESKDNNNTKNYDLNSNKDTTKQNDKGDNTSNNDLNSDVSNKTEKDKIDGQTKDNNNDSINTNNELKNLEEYKKYLDELQKNYEKSKGKGKGKNKHN